jgi:hypothetical protein
LPFSLEEEMMHWSAWIVAALVVLNGGWMAFDGTRAPIAGDYLTPKTGQYAGQLGPWSKVVQAAGIAPRSTLMKSIFVVYGFVYLIVMAAFLLKASWAWPAMLIVAALGLWHLPFGTLINLIVIVLLLLPPLRTQRGQAATKQEKGLGDIKMLWQDDGGKMI